MKKKFFKISVNRDDLYESLKPTLWLKDDETGVHANENGFSDLDNDETRVTLTMMKLE